MRAPISSTAVKPDYAIVQHINKWPEQQLLLRACVMLQGALTGKDESGNVEFP